MIFFMPVEVHEINVLKTLDAYFSYHQYTFSYLQQSSNLPEIGVFEIYLGAQGRTYVAELILEFINCWPCRIVAGHAEEQLFFPVFFLTSVSVADSTPGVCLVLF